MVDIQKLSKNSPKDIFNGGEYRHCHKVKHEALAMDIIKTIFLEIGKTEENFEQIIGGEEIYQIGLESEIRMFGTINGNIFKVYFIDYHHDFEYDERRTTKNKKGNNFCAITSSL